MAEHTTRADLAVMVTCFQPKQFFVLDTTTRLSQLAGLICTESMALWRIFSSQEEDTTENSNNNAIAATDWRSQHPFFQGDSAVEELQALAKLLSDAAAAIDNRWSSMMMDQQPEAPEALALLSFGLLLNAAAGKDPNDDDSVWKNLGTAGFDLAKLANSAYDAFGYLQTVMEHMVLPATANSLNQQQQLQQYLPYDFIEDDKDILLLEQQQQQNGEGDSTNELSAPSLTYASIGRELLTASIYAFQDSVLPSTKLPLPENVGRLSNLVVAIFRNSPTLCERFWFRLGNLYQHAVAKSTTTAAAIVSFATGCPPTGNRGSGGCKGSTTTTTSQ